MSEQEQLPVCVLCGNSTSAWRSSAWVSCSTPGCPCQGVSMPREMWRRLMAPPYEAIDGSDVVTIAVPASSIPAGATLRECYETDSAMIVMGAPDPDDDGHNCDAMGCGPTGHVLYRLPKARPRLAPEHVAWLRQISECSEYGRRAYEELIVEADPAADMAYIRELVASYKRDVDAIRAALAALGIAVEGGQSA